MKQKIIVLDRDGVINEDSDAFIKSPQEWLPVPGSLQAIARLKQAGWTVAVATNQSGIPRGYYSHAILSAMHQKLQRMLGELGCEGVDWISFSPYLSVHNSPCRKPGVGMLQAIENRFGLSLQGAPLVGDTLGDMNAALNRGMQPYLVRTGKGERTLATQDPVLQAIPVYDNLAAVVEEILK
ncbi:D-glycero-beta-D-manno-heptose 1,7-bisphosphate 7-phosphatase [Thiomicrorhabdus sp. zzn3]|uniref:D-glycero-beta-D-manno-heptose 1,7-bisphosphate 7-phosphatase n=1 Tax=Thiomicrorhabdus sp. zzn3 TaxID=3039775 RepID=UPI002436C4F6|nr:D-glycero-beta-D-manno-heptose 1,7-bisphosphate 7-phosphatase [Thiomicrorhabdus sp. zzn3]MDG6779140.1 D-glycero-beta-D-manno-heptose 1,7-bisphosphate 7-phosphatase [Thiomicrorhabdus sp. zzn3]